MTDAIQSGVAGSAVDLAKIEPRQASTATQQPHAAAAPVSAPAAEAPKFLSPVLKVDASSGIAVLEYRDSKTGDEQMQLPSKAILQSYVSAAHIAESPEAAKAAAVAAGPEAAKAETQGQPQPQPQPQPGQAAQTAAAVQAVEASGSVSLSA
jgi:hypothetical protein